MRQHFAKAEFVTAGEVYEAAVRVGAATTYEDDLLRARALLRHDEHRAVAFLIRRPPKSQAGKQRATWALLLGWGYAHMRDFERADHHFAIAKKLFTTPDEQAEVTYHVTRRWILEGRLDDARRAADQMAKEGTNETKIAGEMLRSFIFSQEERYFDSGLSLIRALKLIGNRREAHIEKWYHVVQNLALLGRELAFADAATLAREEIDQPIEWAEDFRSQHFQALKAVGWSCALRGDMLGCFRYLRAAEPAIPNDAFRAILHLDRAYFARIVGELNWSRDEVEKAEAIAERVDWNALSGEERIGLLLLAENTTPIAPERARYYLARYRGLEKVRSPLHMFAFDHRIEAFAAYAEGVVRLGTKAPATEDSLREAWVIFDRIGYDWRAARTAIGLFQVTGKDRWRHLAEDKLETYPRSWLVTELKALDSKPAQPHVTLPPMQSKVFSMLCQKMTTAEIAQQLGLSQHTVRNHLKAVFRAYGVNSRAALIAEAAARGELPPR